MELPGNSIVGSRFLVVSSSPLTEYCFRSQVVWGKSSQETYRIWVLLSLEMTTLQLHHSAECSSDYISFTWLLTTTSPCYASSKFFIGQPPTSSVIFMADLPSRLVSRRHLYNLTGEGGIS